MLLTLRLRIVSVQESDIEFIHGMNLIDKVNEYNTTCIPKDVFETRQKLSKVLDKKNCTSLGWSIYLRENNTFVGEIGMNLSIPKFRMAEIHYSLLPYYWRKGLATEAIKRIIAFGFEELKLHRIEAGVATENIASIKVLEKVGMTREGLRRKILPIRGQWKDNYHYAILDKDYR